MGLFRDRGPKVRRRLQKKLSAALRAEQRATLEGLAAFAAHKTAFSATSPLLRRNIHRLEKGLCMPERRDIFGTAFIGETVALYARLVTSHSAEQAELRWAHDVLTRYFAVTSGSDETIAAARKAFLDLPALESTSAPFAPYTVDELASYASQAGAAQADYPAFLALCRGRRSQRWFEDRPVEMAQIEAATAAALQAPSACNRQPYRFYCATTRPMIDRIAALPLGTAGFGDQLPALIAVVGDLSMYAEPRDRHLIHIDAALAAMQLMLGFTAQGLGSVPINWPDIPENHQALREILGLAPHQVPVMLVGIGHPKADSMVAYSAKREVSEVLSVVD